MTDASIIDGVTEFPPTEPTGLTEVIPSYAYQEYSQYPCDEGILAYVESFNVTAQQYVTYLQTLNLPIYTSPTIAGPLLDWVGAGIYGVLRPVLPSGSKSIIGPYNTFVYNQLAYNEMKVLPPPSIYATTDDIYKRCLTWAYYKDDGKTFTVRWLKRRIARFLYGVNGTSPNIDQTYQISVSFAGNQGNITILNGIRTITGGSLYNASTYNGTAYNQVVSTYSPFPTVTMAAIFKSAVESGALEMPFQKVWTVNV